MRAIAFLWLLAGGAEGRKPLFGQTGGDSNKCGAACEWYASAPVAEDPGATCGSRVEYLMNQEKEDAATACGKIADPRGLRRLGLGDLPAFALPGLGPHGLRR